MLINPFAVNEINAYVDNQRDLYRMDIKFNKSGKNVVCLKVSPPALIYQRPSSRAKHTF